VARTSSLARTLLSAGPSQTKGAWLAAAQIPRAKSGDIRTTVPPLAKSARFPVSR
jgi:hypothetical protein